ncbi:MAG: HPP family protein [Candidatus Contendobacter sp.]|nr:HPP family protein [Candidatus Contendobacter sp.]MDS4058153.1 HPP family protein [Candidatus Contendobacter sp.]
MLTLLQRFLPDTPPLAASEALRTAVAIGVAVLFTGILSPLLVPGALAPVLVASMGASAILLLALPTSPLAQPWPFIGGQLISAIIGISLARWIDPPLLAGGLAVLLSTFVMLRLRCLHPPGGATTLIPVLAHHETPSFGYDYLLAPIAINVLLLLALVWGLNRLLGRTYPHRPRPPLPDPHGTGDPLPTERTGVQEEDVRAVLAKESVMPDIGTAELRRLMARAEDTAVNRVFGEIDCAAVMSREVVTVSSQQPAGEAWRLLRYHKVKALPVLDHFNQLVGMVTLVDFLKHIPIAGLRQDAHTLAVWLSGQSDLEPLIEEVMTRTVQTVREDQSLLDLVPMLSDMNLHHLPVVDAGGKLVGMITQSDLIAGLHWELVRGAMDRRE